MKFCEECEKRSSKIDVCTNCGLVFEDKPIDYRKPYVEDDMSDRLSHLNSMKDFFNEKIFYSSKSYKNKDLKRAIYKYQGNYADWGSWKKKRLKIVKNEAKRVISLLRLSVDFYVSVIYCFNKMSKLKNKKIFGWNVKILAQTLVYLEIKKQGLPTTLYDFKKIDCDIKKIKNCYSRLLKNITVKLTKQEPMIFLSKIIIKLNLKPRQETLLTIACQNFLEKFAVIETELFYHTLFKNPVVKTAACVYILSCELHDISLKKLSDIVGCDSRTVKRRVDEMKKLLSVINVFGFTEERFEDSLIVDEYHLICMNGAEYLDRDICFVNGLINPMFEMKIDKRKVVFY